MTPHPSPSRPSRLEWAGLIVILAVGGWLRFRQLGDVPFGSDAAHMLQMADRLRAGEAILTGIPSSKGVLNPPLAIYLLFLLRLVIRTPLGLAAATAALNLAAVGGTWLLARRWFGPRVAITAAALFAVSGWAVFYSREIWQQDFIPPIGVLALAGTLFWTVERRAWGLGVAIAAAGACSQLHLTGFAWFGVLGLCWIALRPPVRVASLVAGLAACVVMYAPFAVALATIGIGGKKHGAQALFVEMFAAPVRHALGSVTHGGITFDLPALHAALGGSILHPLFDAVPWIGAALAIAGVLACLPPRAAVVRTTDFARFRLDADPARTTLFLWAVAPVAVMVVTGLSTAPHYVILLFPAMWILAAIGADVIGDRIGAPAIAVALPTIVFEILFVLAMQRWIAQDFVRTGGYGPGLRFQEMAIRAIVEDARGDAVTLASAPDPDVPGAPGVTDNYRWLLREEELRTRHRSISDAETGAKKRTFVLLDLGAGQLSKEAQAAIEAHRARRFGPLWVCEWE